MVNLLLDHGADFPVSPLTSAIGNESMFRLLLERGADPRTKKDYSPSDWSLLQEMIRYGSVTLVQELLDRAVPIDRDNLIWDVLKGGEQMVELFLANGMLELPSNRKKVRNERISILLDAARKKQLRLAKCLVERHFRIPVRKVPELLFSLASVACDPGPRGAMADEIFNTLLGCGVDVNSSDSDWYGTALTWSISFDGSECVKHILKKGADPLCENGFNPFQRAAHSSLEMLEALLQAIDIHAVSPRELHERIIRWQHKLVEDHRMDTVEVLERFLIKVNAKFGSV